MIHEMKKMYIHQKGLLYTLFILLLSIIFLIAADRPADPSFSVNLDQYSYYLKKVEGKLEDHTKQFLLDESNAINKAQTSLDQLYNRYYDKDIEEDVFLQERDNLEEILRNQIGFERIFEQYVYVRENPEQRYFLYTNGWAGLLSGDSPDFLMVLLLLLLVSPVFCHEYDCAMDTLSLTMRKGGRYQAACKILLSLASVFFICLFTVGFRYLFFNAKYGLNHGSYPLQSIPDYSTAAKGLSLMEAFLFISSIKILGYLSFAALVLCISVCVKRYSLTLLISTAVILLPFLGMGDTQARYLYTGPLGLMLSNGFFLGDQYKTDPVTGEITLAFKEIPVSSMIAVLCTVLCIMAIMLFIVMHLRSNVWQNMKKRGCRSIVRPFMLLNVLLFLTGCSGQSQQEGYDVYNYLSSMTFQNNRYRFYVDESDIEDIRLVFEDKKSGEVENLVRTPFQSSIEVARMVYGNGDYVYYTRYNIDKSGYREDIDQIAVVEVDTRTFHEKVIYERTINLDRKLLMETIPVNNKDFYNLYGASGFFVDGSSIFFIGNDVRRIDRSTGRMTAIDIPTNGNIAYDGQRIYFIGDRFQLTYYDTETGVFNIYPDIITTKFYLAGHQVIFLNRLDKDKMYVYNVMDHTVKKILDQTAADFSWADGFIYYQNQGDIQEHRFKLDR